MRTESEAIERARPRLRYYNAWVIFIGVTALTIGVIAEQDDYYRRGPSYWPALVIACTLGLLARPAFALFLDHSHLDPDLKRVRLDEIAQVPVLERIDVDIRHKLRERHDAVKADYGAFLCDISQILQMPLLADESVEDTHAFVSYLVTCEDAARGSDLEYERAVDGLEIRWKAARNFARKKRWSTLDPQESNSVRRAKALLDRALDATATAPERQASLRKALDLLGSVVQVPEQAVSAITDKVERTALDPGDDMRRTVGGSA